jgi:hypothetical protein
MTLGEDSPHLTLVHLGGCHVAFEGPIVNFRAIIRFLFNLLDNNSIGRITERNTITIYTKFILGNPHGGENPTKDSLI